MMLLRTKKTVAILALVSGLTLSGFAFISRRGKPRPPRSEAVQDPVAVRPAADKIRAGALGPQLRLYLRAFGDRLERTGIERLTFVGTLERAGEQPVTVTGISEFPDRLQITMQSTLTTRTLVFDGQSARVVGGTLSNADRDLIESVVYDPAEHFFRAQMQGASVRHLGNHFRADDGSTVDYSGPVYDVFSLMDRIAVTAESRLTNKLYAFNSRTRLLEQVRYEISREGSSVQIETQFSGWRRAQNQQVPGRIIRKHNGEQVFNLTITSAAFSPRVSDGMF